MRFLIIGLGSIGCRHAENLLQEGHEVFGFDIDPTRTGPEGVQITLDIYRDVDAWLICTPVEQHLGYLQLSQEQGLHVFCEKPICPPQKYNCAQIESLAKRAWINNRVFMVGNQLRYNGVVRVVKDWLTDGIIGMPRWVNILLAQKNERYQDPVELNWGAHELDLALHWFGPLKKLIFAEIQFDHASFGLRHESEICSYVHLDYQSERWLRQGFIFGTKGLIEYDIENGYANLWTDEFKQDSPAVLEPVTIPPSRHVAVQGRDVDYLLEIRDFARAITRHENPQGATAADALAVIKILMEAKGS